MDLTYMKGAKVGDDVLIDAKLLRKGRNLAFLEVELKNKNTNDVLVKGSHTKFIGSSWFHSKFKMQSLVREIGVMMQ